MTFLTIVAYFQSIELTWNLLANIAIALCGATAVFLSQSVYEERRKWACILGLIGQPAWFYSSYVSGNWGIFAVCFLYLFSWLKGLWAFWLKPWYLKVQLARRLAEMDREKWSIWEQREIWDGKTDHGPSPREILGQPPFAPEKTWTSRVPSPPVRPKLRSQDGFGAKFQTESSSSERRHHR